MSVDSIRTLISITSIQIESSQTILGGSNAEGQVKHLYGFEKKSPNNGQILEFHNLRMQRTCQANPAGESSSFIFTVFVKSVRLYHLKLAYVVLHVAVK